MDELKSQESEALDILESMLDAADAESTTHTGVTNWDKPIRSGNCRILADDAAKLRQYIAYRRAAPENKALTLEELEATIENRPKGWLWLEDLTDSKNSAYQRNDKTYRWSNITNYSKTWIAYARKPEGSDSP